MPYRYRYHWAERNQMPLSTRDSVCNNISFSSADGDRVQKNDVSIRLRHNENEEEIPITDM